MRTIERAEAELAKAKKRPRRNRRGERAAWGRQADKLWSLVVRAKGRCEAEGEHKGTLQGAHGFSRRYRNTRWLPINGFCLCAAHHVYFTHRPIEWDNWLRVAWGDLAYNELRLLALRTTPPDPTEAVAKLEQEAEKLGVW